jgi:hypothetical protein
MIAMIKTIMVAVFINCPEMLGTLILLIIIDFFCKS